MDLLKLLNFYDHGSTISSPQNHERSTISLWSDFYPLIGGVCPAPRGFRGGGIFLSPVKIQPKQTWTSHKLKNVSVTWSWGNVSQVYFLQENPEFVLFPSSLCSPDLRCGGRWRAAALMEVLVRIRFSEPSSWKLLGSTVSLFCSGWIWTHFSRTISAGLAPSAWDLWVWFWWVWITGSGLFWWLNLRSVLFSVTDFCIFSFVGDF